MKRKVFFFGLIGVLLVMFLTGCPGTNGLDESAKTVIITGLPDTVNGAMIQVGLFETKSLQDPDISGWGTIENGSATAPLYENDAPWTGTGAWYVAFQIENVAVYVTTAAKSFSAGSVTVALSECEEVATGSDRGEKIGEIRGTITLTNLPDPRPTVSIRAANEANYEWSSHRNNINLSGAGGSAATDIAWTIPVYGEDSNGSLQGQSGTRQVVFSLYVSVGGGSSYTVDIPGSKTLDLSSLSSMDVGSLGSVSLASVALSGTITASNAGQPIPRISISARVGGQNNEVGYTSINPTTATTQWTMTIPAQQGGAVTFHAYGYESSNSGNQLFYKTFAPAQTASVTDQAISGIALDAGDISVGRLSGTVSFTGALPASYQLYLSARYGADNNGQWISGGRSYTVTVSGAAGTWAIPGDDAFLAALDSGSQTVTFRLYLQSIGGGGSVTLPEIQRTVANRDALTGINLGSVSVGLVTLSGTITASNAGQPIPRISISARGGEQNNEVGYTSINPTTTTTQWTMAIPAQQGGAVTFEAYGLDSPNGGNQLFRKTFAPAQTVSVRDQAISGIAFDAGDISVGRLSGTMTFTSMHSPAPFAVLVQAFTYYPMSGSDSDRSYMEDTSYHAIAVNGSAGTWTIPKDDKFLTELEKENQMVRFFVAVQMSQGEDYFDVTHVDAEVDKNTLSNIDLGDIAIPQYIKLSGSFAGSYNGASLPRVTIYARGASGSQLGSSFFLTAPAASGVPWFLYLPAPASPLEVVFTVNSYSGNTALFNIMAPQTASVSNQDVSGIALDVGNIVPNTLRVSNPPSGAYTAYVTDTYISQSNYASVSQSGNHVASGSGSGSSIPLSWTSTPGNNSKHVLIDAANGVIKYSSWTTFANGIGSVDWNAMTEVTAAPQLPAPGNLSVTAATASSISLSWNSVGGASSYRVYRSAGSSGSYSQIASPNGTSYSNTGLSASTTYYYKVAAVASDGTVGTQSAAVSGTTESSGGPAPGGDTLAGAKGKLTLSGFSQFNGAYVYSALVTSSGKALIGTNGVEVNAGVFSISMVPISGGTAVVPLYTTKATGTTVADVYVPYEGSEAFQMVSILIVNDADGKFTAADAASMATNYVAMIGSNASNTSFTPSTSGGNITVNRSDVMTTEEISAEVAAGNYAIMQTVKYMLMINSNL
jgi:hypothetical protein